MFQFLALRPLPFVHYLGDLIWFHGFKYDLYINDSYMHILSPNQTLKSYRALYKTTPSGHRIDTWKLTCLKANFCYTPTCLFYSVPIPANDDLILPIIQDKILDVNLIPSYINHQQILLVFLQRSMKNLFWNVCHHSLLSLLLTSLYKL